MQLHAVSGHTPRVSYVCFWDSTDYTIPSEAYTYNQPFIDVIDCYIMLFLVL